MNGKAQAAALISPYTEVAEELGFKKVFQTKMVDVLAYIARSDLSESEISAFLRGVEEAIAWVKRNPAKYKPLYVRILRETLSGYPPQLRDKALRAAKRVEGRIGVVHWGELKPYSKETFSVIERWMTSHSLLERPITYEQLVNNAPLERVLTTSRK